MLKKMKKLMFALLVALSVFVVFGCNQECEKCEECPSTDGLIKPEDCPAGDDCTGKIDPEDCPAGDDCTGLIKPEDCPAGDDCTGKIDPEDCPECEDCTGKIDPEECPSTDGLIKPEECPETEQDYIAPDGFELYDELVAVGDTVQMYYEEFTPKGAYEGLIWSSSDERFATVDEEGVVTGIRPGTVYITATSILNPEVSRTVEVVVEETGLVDADIANREKEYILSQLPIYVAADFEFPQPWNTATEVVFELDGVAQEKFVYPTDLEGDKAVDYKVYITYGDAKTSADVKFWVVKDYNDNAYTRVETAKAAAGAILGTYTNGEDKVSENVSLPDYIYGVKMNWGTSLRSALTADGEYTRPLDDKAVTLDITCEYGPYTSTGKFNVVVKGYSADEKVEYILTEGTLAQINGKKVNTSLVLPAYDSKFDVKLSYKSNNPEVYGDDGKLVAAPAEEKEVTFTVTADYQISNVEKFTKEFELKVIAAPANAAAQAAEKWLAEAGYNKEVHFPYGSEKGNVLDVPTTYADGEKEYAVSWDVEAVKLYAKGAEEEVQVFELNEEGKVELVVQYLRYTQVQLKGTFTDGEESAEVVLQLNVGVSESAANIYSATWRNTAQPDGSVSLEQGLYDVVNNVSYYDAPISYAGDSYGSGKWSGYTISTDTQYDGKVYEDFVMELMTVYIREDAQGNLYIDKANVYSGDGGNWGLFFVNTTNKDFDVEVGLYNATGELFKDGVAIEASTGNRTGLTFDGYANGWVADATGKVIVGSETAKFQNGIDSTAVKSFGSYSASYVTIPAGGYGMSWKYQFYGVGAVAAIYPFCKVGTQLTIKAYDVHPLSDYDAAEATKALAAAEELIAAQDLANNGSLEANLIKARNLYNGLEGATKANVFAEERLAAAEVAGAKLIDAEITEVLQLVADEAEGFTLKVGALNTRLEKYTAELTALLENKAAFDAKYAELAAIDLTVTLDYQGGYAKGFYKNSDYQTVIFGQFLPDLYAHLVKVGAFKKDVVEGALVDNAEKAVPTYEEFATADYFTKNYAKNDYTILSFYLFTPKYASQTAEANESYRDVIEGSEVFFNTPEGNKWIDIMNWVDEGTRGGNMSGQDAYGRYNEVSQATEYADKGGNPSLVQYGGKDVVITNSGTVLGAYRFAQYIAGGLNDKTYKQTIPANVYAAIFDRQQTQENYSTVVYHCTDAAVALPETAHKDGYEFLGWFFEDGTKAEITGATFANVTVYAKWLAKLESSVEEAVGAEVEPVYYGQPAKEGYQGTTEPGDLATQNAVVGIGKYAVVVDGKMFVMPKYALIELGKDATETVTADKDMLRPYARDAYDNNSTGLIYDAATDSVTGKNSYGHGALYMNAGEQVVNIPDTTLCYGRSGLPSPTENFGYHRYIFQYNAETKTYTAKLVGDSGEATLNPGDFLWCPMTADRYCSGLTDCTGVSGVKGVLTDGIEVKVVDISGFVPAELPWYTVEFVNGEEVIDTLYLDKGEKVVKPADLEKAGFTFLGWATSADATEAEEVAEVAGADVTYYAVWQEQDMYEATTVNPAADGSVATEFTTIDAAIKKTQDGGVVTVMAGTYAETLKIERPVTILGPNAGVKGYAARAEEAKFEGTISINSQGVTIDGLAFTGHEAKITESVNGTDRAATVIMQSADDFKFVNNYVTSGKGIVFEVNTAVNFEMSNNFFDWTKENGATGAWAWRPIRIDGKVTNFVFANNKVIQTADDDTSAGLYDIVYIQNAAGTVDIVNNNLVGYSYNWNFNIANAKEVTELNFNYNYVDGVVTDGVNSGNTTINVSGMGDNTNANYIGNVVNTAGTTYSYDVADAATYAGTITVTGNKFYSETYKPRIKKALAAERVVHADNYIKAAAVTATGSFTFTMDGNVTDEAAFDAVKYEATAKEFTVNKFACGYVNGTHVYLASKYQFNAYYEAEVALQYDVATGAYVVVAAEQNCSLQPGEYDLLLAVHGSCAAAAAAEVIKGLKVGDKVVIEADYATLTGYTASTDVAIKVLVYAAK